MSLRALLDGLAIPIVQAPMLGASTEVLAAAVCGAGGLGALAAGGLAPADIGPAVEAMRHAAARPFAVNLLMAPDATPDSETVARALAVLEPWYADAGQALPATPNAFAPDFSAQFEALADAAPPIASFAFGLLHPDQVARLHARGTYVVGTATTVAEAIAWADAGADGICAQGAEAGGHRGHFLADLDASLVGTLALTRGVLSAVDLPVIAAGGIMDGQGLAAVLALGASAAQMGTAFLLSDEAVTSRPWRAAITAAPSDATRVTRAFTGRPARGIENRFMREMRPHEADVPDYPVQNRLTQPLRAAALAAGDAELLSLWAGQGVTLAQAGAAGDLMRTWWAEAAEAASRLSERTGRGRS